MSSIRFVLTLNHKTMLSVILLYVVSSLLTPQLALCQDDVNMAKYVGCVSTRYAQKRDLGQSFYPFSWESCVLLCQSKAARYAGLSQRKRMCFCGSYLLENSKLLSPKDCPYSCPGITRRGCGGDGSMTLYQLKDDDSPRVLLATSKSIHYVSNNRVIPLITIPIGTIHGRIRYHYRYNQIYFAAECSIYRSQYSTVRNTYDPATPVISAGKNKPYTVDWVNDKLYYTKNYKIWEASLNGTDLNVVHTFAGGVGRMEIDPYDKKLFYSFGPSFRVLNLQTYVETTIFKSASSIRFPMSLNVHTQTVYGIKNNKVMNKNYLHAPFRAVFQAPYEGSILDVMAIDEDDLICVHNSDEKLSIFYNFKRVQLDLKSDQYRSSLAIHEKIQAPTKNIACLKLRCSHECEYSPSSFAHCLCPGEMQLDTSERRCRKIRLSRYSSEESDCGSESDCSSRSYSEEDESSDYYERSDDDSRYYSENDEDSRSKENSRFLDK